MNCNIWIQIRSFSWTIYYMTYIQLDHLKLNFVLTVMYDCMHAWQLNSDFNLRYKMLIYQTPDTKFQETFFHWKHINFYLSLWMFNSPCYNFHPWLKFPANHLSLSFFYLFIPIENFSLMSPSGLEFSLWAEFAEFHTRLKSPCNCQIYFKRISCRNLSWITQSEIT